MKVATLTCRVCKRAFERRASLAAYCQRQGFRTFCSRTCVGKATAERLLNAGRKLKHYMHFVCEVCGNSFERSGAVARARLTEKGHWPRFCNRGCYGKYKSRTADPTRMRTMRALQQPQKRLGSTPNCGQCGNPFYTKKHRLLEGRGKFCSFFCYGAYRKEHPELSIPSAGAHPSKIQIMLTQDLRAHGYWVESEVPMLDVGTIVDIVLPKHGIAIYVDGRYWHRGREQSDFRITRQLETLGWNVIRISDTEAQKVVKGKAQLILPVPSQREGVEYLVPAGN